MTTWNPADKAAGITLSGGNLTATGSGSTGAVRATTSNSSSKWYLEYVLTTVGATAAQYRVGFATSSQSLTTILGSSTASVGYDPVNGHVLINGSSLSTIATAVTGNTVGMAIDIGNKLIWIAVNGGNWNNSPTANPSTGSGGISLSTLASFTLFPAFASAANLNACTIAPTGPTYGPPSGFTDWDSAVFIPAVYAGALGYFPLGAEVLGDILSNTFSIVSYSGAFIETLISSPSYSANNIEIIEGVSVREGIDIEFLGNERINSNALAEYIGNLISDDRIEIEFLESQRAQGVIEIEFLSKLVTDEVVQLEVLTSSHSILSSISLETLIKVQGDDLVRLELLEGQTTKSTAPTEILGGVKSNQLPNIELLSDLVMKPLVEIELTSNEVFKSIFTDEIILKANSIEGNIALETLPLVKARSQFLSEIVSSTIPVTSSSLIGLEFLGDSRTDGLVNLEVVALTSPKSMVMPLELLSKQISFDIIPIELTSGFTVTSDAIFSLELLGGAATKNLVNLEVISNLRFNLKSTLELISATRSDGTISLESLAKLHGQMVSFLELISSFVTRENSLIEFYGQLSAINSRISLENISRIESFDALPLETIGGLIVRQENLTEIIKAVETLTTFKDEIIAAARFSNEVSIELLGNLHASQIFMLEEIGSLVSKMILRIEEILGIKGLSTPGVELIASAAAISKTLELEFIAKALTNRGLSLELLRNVTNIKSSVQIEALGQLRSYTQLLLEFFGQGLFLGLAIASDAAVYLAQATDSPLCLASPRDSALAIAIASDE